VARREYVPATPRYAAWLADESGRQLAEAEELRGDASGMGRCAVLRPVLALMYEGRIDDGVTLLRRLYQGADADAFARQTIEMVRSSPLWAPR
jgi:hypothetical protein